MKNYSEEDLMKQLVSLNTQVLKEFFHRCADDICGRKGPSIEALEHAVDWTPQQFEEACCGSKAFICNAVQEGYDTKKIEELMSILDADQLQGITSCISTRRDELKEHILSVTANTPGNAVVDFDWKVKWVLGSSSLSTLQEPLLSLDITTAQRSVSLKHEQYNTLNIELNQDELGTLLTALESVEETLSE